MSTASFQPFPLLAVLPEHQREGLLENVQVLRLEKDEYLGIGEQTCLGWVHVKSGGLRAFIQEENGGEVTLLRLRGGDQCVLTAACALSNIKFDLHFHAVERSELFLLPEHLLEPVASRYPELQIAIQNELLGRFSDVVFLLSTMLGQKMHQRLAAELLFWADERGHVKQTHETLARQLNTAREVVSRTVKYLEQERVVVSRRGQIEILDPVGLKRLASTEEG